MQTDGELEEYERHGLKGRSSHALHVQDQYQVVVATREELEDLAADLEALRHGPHADLRLEKRLVRTLINEIVVDVDADGGEVILVVHWKGGLHTELPLARRGRGQKSRRTSKTSLKQCGCWRGSVRMIC